MFSTINAVARYTRANLPAARDARSVGLEDIPVFRPESRILPCLVEHAVADHERLEVASHETAEGVLGRAHDGLAAHIEARVDEDGTTRARLERRQQRVKTRIGVPVHGLDARRIIDV